MMYCVRPTNPSFLSFSIIGKVLRMGFCCSKGEDTSGAVPPPESYQKLVMKTGWRDANEKKFVHITPEGRISIMVREDTDGVTKEVSPLFCSFMYYYFFNIFWDELILYVSVRGLFGECALFGVGSLDSAISLRMLY